MKIGVISDTHLKAPSKLLEMTFEQYFRDMDMIVHAGDICSLDVLDVFRSKTVYAVSGNRDHRNVKEKLPTELIIEANGYRIGLTHGWGSPFGIHKRVRRRFKDVNCIIFGHSHRPCERVEDGVILFNPGSFASSIFSLWRRSIGILTIDKGIQTQIIKI